MQILITGASGVIGRRIVPQLIARGDHVTAIGRSPTRLADLARQGARATTLDLYDRDAVRAAVRGQEVVINLATSIPAGVRMILPGGWRETNRLRREASAILAGAATEAGVARFLQESFAPAYPDHGDRWITEELPLRSVRYNRGLAGAEASAARFTERGGSGSTLRFGMFYGDDDPFTQQLLSSVRSGRLPLFGSPEAYISFVHHDDAASAVVAAIDAPAGPYNVVDDEPLRRRELGALLAKHLGVREPKLLPSWMVYLAGSLGETLSRSQRISNSRLEGETRWVPRFARFTVE
jgi:2-alkyl-3-oxoalkanoate reductase